jgi:transcriptional regulator with XRE-family HTH domain
MNENELSAWINSIMEKRNLGVREIAKKVGVSHPTILIAINDGKASFETCKKLSKAFNVPLDFVLKKAGHINITSSKDEWLEEINFIYGKLENKQDRLEILEQSRLRMRIQEERGSYVPGIESKPKSP